MMMRVLIVDDSLTVRRDLEEAFEDAGFTVSACATLADARREIARQAPSLVVLDMLLPDGSGLDLLEELKLTAPAVPVLALSTEAEVRDRVRGLAVGADDYVGKPYERSYVVARARQLLGVEGKSDVPVVVVIDDSATVRMHVGEALRAAGFRAVLAADGHEGLRLAAELRPDLVVVDGHMPGLDGATVIRRIRLDASLRDTPCLLLTGSLDADAELCALESGADAFLQKSEGIEVMLARVQALLRTARRSPESPASSLALRRVLCVDDSPTFLEALAAALREEGYEIAKAHSGEQALQLLEVQEVDCILVDLVMPGMSGFETCLAMKRAVRWRHIPLLMLTASDQRDALVDSINAGADDFVRKGADFEVLKARVRALLRRRQFEEESVRVRDELTRMALETEGVRRVADARAKLLQELQDKNAQLEAANRGLLAAKEQAILQSEYKSRFLANMSHELRTPLNAIIGFSELLEQGLGGPISDKQAQYLGHVLGAGRHLLALLNEVLDLAKVESGKVELDRTWAELGPVIDNCIALVRPSAASRGIELTADVPPDLPALHVDVTRMRQVLCNLLSNGIKFTPEGGHVSLSASFDDGMVELRVEDTGVGIAAEDRGRLFHEFERIDRGPKQEGTGLGLALSQKLVLLHGGCIQVESEPGAGSAFRVLLPRVRRSIPPAAGAQRGSARPPGDGPLALVVEDDPKSSELLALHLEALGYSVVAAAEHRRALRLASELVPDVITLDIRIPEVNGWALLTQLKTTAATAAIPVIVVTVVDDPERSMTLGAAAFVGKPVSRDALASALESAELPIHDVVGLRLAHLGDPSLAESLETLALAGCELLGDVRSLDRPGPVDVVLADLDLLSDPALRAQLERLAPKAIVGFGDAPRDVRVARHFPREDVGRFDALVRTLAATAPRHTLLTDRATGLPARARLLRHLQQLTARADAMHGDCALAAARVSLAAARRNVQGLTALSRRQRPGELVGLAGHDAIALVSTASASLDRRLSAMLREEVGLEPERCVVLRYPEDADGAAALLGCALSAIGAGTRPPEDLS